ncbi:MAG: DUF3160 domain-containing protein [Abitibacteriaceae bacterium]|nr:DUF3160 domain-containing protein [Abditibacteriaceae bacterium]
MGSRVGAWLYIGSLGAGLWGVNQGAAHAQSTASAPVVAQVKPYSVSPSLQQVSNLKAFTKAFPLKPAQQQMLAKNLFVCAPTNAVQLFHLYEVNDYKNVPSFITTDAVLQLYHIFFDFTLRKVETDSLTPVLKRLTQGMLKQSIATWNESTDPQLKQAALKNIAYFGVADRILGLTDTIPFEATQWIAKDLALMGKHAGFDQGAIFPYKVDYSQFVPRGHYTRTVVLQRFFKTMMWYGLAPFSLHYADEGGEKRADEQIRQGLLWVRDLNRANLLEDWNTIYEPTSFFVGFSDDLTPAEWKSAMDGTFGANADPTAFADSSKFEAFVAAADKLRPAAITPNFGRLNGVPKGTPRMIEPPLPSGNQLRFMGQRYIPDSEVLQRLSVPVQRVFPSGLDVMAALGSTRARANLDTYANIYNASHWSGYQPEREKLISEFHARQPATWTSNLYWSWLHVLQSLLQPTPSGYPSFMRNAAWQDKSLHTALASWAELRHDTILYGKQSVTECGDGGEDKPFVKGYVEPNVVFWDRLLQLTKQSREGLVKRKLLGDELKGKFEEFDDMLTMLRRISVKELHNQKLTQQEYEEIRYLGGKLDYLTLSTIDGRPSRWELVSDTDKNMATVADVHTGGDKVLEEGVGHACEILAIVPIEGKLSLTRGAALSYYEFKHPISDRLTDERWQAMLKAGKTPASPVWTKSFLVPLKPAPITAAEMEQYDSGC